MPGLVITIHINWTTGIFLEWRLSPHQVSLKQATASLCLSSLSAVPDLSGVPPDYHDFREVFRKTKATSASSHLFTIDLLPGTFHPRESFAPCQFQRGTVTNQWWSWTVTGQLNVCMCEWALPLHFSRPFDWLAISGLVLKHWGTLEVYGELNSDGVWWIELWYTLTNSETEGYVVNIKVPFFVNQDSFFRQCNVVS